MLVVFIGVIAGVALFISFVVGAHVGAVEYIEMNSSTRAYLLVHDLQAIRPSGNEKLIGAKEVELDGEVTRALRFQEFGHPWMFWPFSEGYDHERYLRAVAVYRNAHPSPTPTLEFGGDDDQRREMKIYRAEVATRTAQLLERYGK